MRTENQKRFELQVLQEIKALREVGVNVSDHAETYARLHSDNFGHMSVSDYVDMCITATS